MTQSYPEGPEVTPRGQEVIVTAGARCPNLPEPLMKWGSPHPLPPQPPEPTPWAESSGQIEARSLGFLQRWGGWRGEAEEWTGHAMFLPNTWEPSPQDISHRRLPKAPLLSQAVENRAQCRSLRTGPVLKAPPIWLGRQDG